MLKKTSEKVEVRNGTELLKRQVWKDEDGKEYVKYDGKYHYLVRGKHENEIGIWYYGMTREEKYGL